MSCFDKFGIPVKSGFQVGIEIELEMQSDHTFYGFRWDTPDTSMWVRERDGSLRRGVELVLRKPLGYNEALSALSEAGSIIRSHDMVSGQRCSTHIHVNVSDLSHEEFRKFMYLSLCLEPLLMEYCSSWRKDNNYCMPTYKSVNLVREYRRALDFIKDVDLDSVPEGMHPMDWLSPPEIAKYSAISLFRLFDLGTVEFRMFDGSTDMSKLSAILGILREIYNSSQSKDIHELISEKTQSGVLSLITPQLREVVGSKLRISELESLMETGVRMANDMICDPVTQEKLEEMFKELFPDCSLEPPTEDEREEAIKDVAFGGMSCEEFIARFRGANMTMSDFSALAQHSSSLDDAYAAFSRLSELQRASTRTPEGTIAGHQGRTSGDGFANIPQPSMEDNIDEDF